MTAGSFDLVCEVVVDDALLELTNRNVIAIDGSQGYSRSSDAQAMGAEVIRGAYAGADVTRSP